MESFSVSCMMSHMNTYFSDGLCKDWYITVLERIYGELFYTKKGQSAEKSFSNWNVMRVNPLLRWSLVGKGPVFLRSEWVSCASTWVTVQC